ncbi:OmpA family protein [candidate division KSB1 bacterium]|nr:OmpA family protein [candidate division KSB1 bacterium]
MKAALTIMILLFLILIGAGFYYFYFQVIPLRIELSRLNAENAQLKETNLQLQAQNNSLLDEKQKKEQELNSATQTYQNLISDLEKEIKDGQIKISELSGKLNLKIEDKILFDSGDATLSSQGQKIITRIGNILKQDTSRVIRVEGHTDNVKIHRRLQKQFPSNWELSTSRATHVVRFLQDKLKIDGERLEAVGYSEYKPVASNKTENGRSQNRRIEIMMVPK